MSSLCWRGELRAERSVSPRTNKALPLPALGSLVKEEMSKHASQDVTVTEQGRAAGLWVPAICTTPSVVPLPAV